ncbi:MAG: amino acid carrier protein [Eubacteriales bacterium]
MQNWLLFLNEYLFGVSVPLLLLGTGVYLGHRLGWFPFRHPVRTLRAMLAKEEGTVNQTSPFRALTMAMAGTLGIGNIAGVALALVYGGAGAIFWMWCSALLAMLIKYAEILLAVDKRRRTAGGYESAAMFYIQGSRKLSRSAAAVFALCCLGCSLMMGSVIQSNAVAEVCERTLGVPPLASGVALALLTALVVFGGARKISGVTLYLIPLVSLLYVLFSGYIILADWRALPAVFGRIFREAFALRPAAGGVAGFLFSDALRLGCTRGLLTNEAGCGTAPMAHATADTKVPAKQALWGIFEVFADTLLLCTLTALVVLLRVDPLPRETGSGMLVVLDAFRTAYGGLADLLLSVAAFVFVYATVLCWSYYGTGCLRYFTQKESSRQGYLCLFCCSIIVGSVSAPALLWGLTDGLLGLMTLINLTALLSHADRVVSLSRDALPFIGARTRAGGRRVRRRR